MGTIFEWNGKELEYYIRWWYLINGEEFMLNI